MKPVLVIGCSAAKQVGEFPALDLYTGNMYQMLSARCKSPLDTFEILVLSARHGLISASEIITDYDCVMPSRKNVRAIEAFASTHGRAARKLLRSVADRERPLFVCLTNKYLDAFDKMIGEKELRLFKSHYVSRKHKGIGELRGRFARVLDMVSQSNTEIEPVVFRSGVANTSELGYVAAGCSVGASLAETNTNRMSHLLVELLRTTTHRPLFLDNGLISLLSQSKSFNTDWVFKQYLDIASSLTKKAAKNLYVVIPDDVTCNQKAVAIVERHRKEILQLSKMTEVILPIHRSDDIETHALNMMKALGYPRNIRLGVPCLKNKKVDLMLQLEDIERLLSIKHPRKDIKLFSKVHFFALTEKSSHKKLMPRLMLANLYGVNISMDGCRTTALFGTNRKGKAMEQQVVDEYLKPQVIASEAFNSHSFSTEFHQPEAEPVVTQAFYDMINEFEIFDFWCVYNELMADNPSLQVDHSFEVGEEFEAMELAWQLTSTKAVDTYLFQQLKLMNWSKFKHACDNLTHIAPNVLRFESIKRLFTGHQTGQPVQMPLTLSA